MIRALFFTTSLLATLLACAQATLVDSLRTTWSDTTLASRQRVPALARWLDMDSTMSIGQAVHMVIGARVDTGSKAYTRQLGLATLSRCSAYGHGRQFTKAIATGKEALRIAQRAGHTEDIALAHTYLGRQLNEVGTHGEAAEHELAALRGYELVQDTFGQISMNYGLAFSFSTQGIHDRAIDYYKRNLELVRNRQPGQVVDVLMRIADLYRDMDDRRTALAWLDSATRVVQHEGGVDPERMINWMRGDMLLDDGDCAGALAELRQSFAAIDAQAFNPAGKSWIRSRIAMAYSCAKEYRAALEWAKAGLAMAEEHHLRKEELDNLYPLAQAYEGLGDAREALRYYKRYHALLDSVVNTDAARSLSDAALTLDFEKQQLADSLVAVQHQRDAEATIVKERNRRNVLLVAGLFAVVMGSISYRQRRRTQKALKRSDELLLNILPEDVADELKAKGHADAKHFDQVTILFTDFKGFTEASTKLSPQELVEELNVCFKAFDGIITARGIEKIKTIGDAYMCAGGLPDPATSSPSDVVHAALEMQAFIETRHTERSAQGLPAFRMRVGIHSGPVVAGIVGVKKFQYDIWGDTVNTASRMESSGEVGQVNISEATYRAVVGAQLTVDGLGNGSRTTDDRQLTAPALTFTPRGKVQAKGKGELEMFFVDRSAA